MLRLLALLALLPIVGCGPEAPCLPPGWDEADVRRAFLRQQAGRYPDGTEVESRALTWGSVSPTENEHAARAAAVVWLKAEEQFYLATYFTPATASEQGEVVAAEAFNEPIRRLDVRHYLDAHFRTGRRGWSPETNEVLRVDVPDSTSFTLADHVCSEAFEVVVGGEQMGPPAGIGAYADKPATTHRVDWAEADSLFLLKLGERLYTAQSCNTCHSVDGTDKIGGSLAGLLGTARPLLQDGEAVVADSAYFVRAIRNPNAEVVCGYPAVMPAYTSTQLSDHDVAALLAYTRSLPEPAAREDRSDAPTCERRPFPERRGRGR